MICVVKRNLIFVCLIFFIFSCFEKNSEENLNKIIKNDETILISSFNALRLGEKRKDYRTLSKILSNFD